MNWNSVPEFFAMGGYGLYVWGSFAVTAACLLSELALLRRRRNMALASANSGLVIDYGSFE
jgi:heme exporter protein D